MKLLQNPHVFPMCDRCTIPCACHARRHLNIQECSVAVIFFTLLSWKCASGHNGVHFFDISTSKSVPGMVCFVHCDLETCASRHNGVHFFDIPTSKSGLRPSVFYIFDFDMCFAPQRRATFHLSSGQMAPHPPL